VLFNSYYNGIGEQFPRARRGLMTHPSLEQVLRYRAHVDEHLAALLERRAGDARIAALVRLGLQHEQQHQELLLTDIKHALSFSPGHRAYARRWPMAQVQGQPLRWLGFEGGVFEQGHDALLDGAFAFDNETPRHRSLLGAFELASRPVSYGDYCAFIDDAGYRRAELWLSLGWDWVCQGQRSAPLYWRQRDDRWFNHTLQGEVEIDPRSPVCHLSYFEADAYARWAGARLPTEAEWECAARNVPGTPAGNFADRGAFHPMPDTEPAGRHPAQLYGDVWEWTQSSYAPYPGYRPLTGAVGEYNGKFMCNQYVLRGGSCATPAGHVRASYRNFFPPEAQWQFSGLRLARDA
jgi:ergothioneine biosynthesis protein EgtB